MEVILLKDIKGTGKRGNIKDVKEGYARNFLIPQRAAEIATPEALARLAADRIRTEAEHTALLVILHAEAERAKAEILEFKLKTGGKGEVFGSITAKSIDQALLAKGCLHARAELRHPVKTLGDISVEIDFGEGIKTALIVRAVPES